MVKMATAVLAEMDKLFAARRLRRFKKLIEDNKMKCAISKTCNWTDVREFNLMFKTEFWRCNCENPDDNMVYLRPKQHRVFL